MSVWFEGSGDIECGILRVKESFENHGQHYVDVINLMPGLSSVELVEHGIDFVTLKTNEGLMKRTNLSIRINTDSVLVESDEEYQAGRMITTKSHFRDEFKTSDGGVTHHLVINNLQAPGFLGFFYRNFGGSKTGNAFLNSYKRYFEQQNP